jgi:hypothetical protein
VSDKTLIFDASPLNHFARAGELDTLQQLVSGHRCVVTVACSAGTPSRDYPLP